MELKSLSDSSAHLFCKLDLDSGTLSLVSLNHCQSSLILQDYTSNPLLLQRDHMICDITRQSYEIYLFIYAHFTMHSL